MPFLAVNHKRAVHYPTNPRLQTYYFKRFAFRPGRLSLFCEKLYFKAKMLSPEFKLFHPSIYTENLAQVSIKRYRCPVVITIHDMIEELYPESDQYGLRRKQKAEALDVASAVICVSENTKKDLINIYPNIKAPIYVTHLASDLNLGIAYGDAPVPERPYFLHVGYRHAAYKNFNTLLIAFHKIAGACPETILCLVGPPLSSDEEQKISELGLTERVQYLGRPDDYHLSKLYRCSLALVYPSLYEGFGIPPLEAMACGTIPMASNCASLPEVMGDAGILFNPHLPDELAEQMLSVARNEINRDKFVNDGILRSKHFSWENTAAKTATIYRSLST
jgi:glycosyltransferase involved in cell wall biosynthesis